MAPLIQTLDPGLSVEEKFSTLLPLLPFRVLRGFFPFSFPVSEFPHHYHQWTAPNANSSAFVTLHWLKCRIQIEMLVLSCHLGMSSWVWNELFSLLDPDGSDGDVLELSWECCREQSGDGTGWGGTWRRFSASAHSLFCEAKSVSCCPLARVMYKACTVSPAFGNSMLILTGWNAPSSLRQKD